MQENSHYRTSLRRKSGKAFDIIVHPSPKAQAVIINIPGRNGHIDGYHGKYRKLASHMSERGAAFIQMPNDVHPGEEYEVSIAEEFHAAYGYALGAAGEFSGTSRPHVYLMGTSAGAAVAATLAYKYAPIKKMLLVAPAAIELPMVQVGLSQYGGQTYILIGKNDEVVSPSNGRKYRDLARIASKAELVEVPNCDHNFSSEANQRILTQALYWAFWGERSFSKFVAAESKPLFDDPFAQRIARSFAQ